MSTPEALARDRVARQMDEEPLRGETDRYLRRPKPHASLYGDPFTRVTAQAGTWYPTAPTASVGAADHCA